VACLVVRQQPLTITFLSQRAKSPGLTDADSPPLPSDALLVLVLKDRTSPIVTRSPSMIGD